MATVSLVKTPQSGTSYLTLWETLTSTNLDED
jgi:hypothetical protein